MNFLFVYSVLGSHTIGSPSRSVTHYGMGHTIKHRYGIVDLLVVSIKDFANILIHVHTCTKHCTKKAIKCMLYMYMYVCTCIL